MKPIHQTCSNEKGNQTQRLPANFPPYILSPPVPANQVKFVMNLGMNIEVEQRICVNQKI